MTRALAIPVASERPCPGCGDIIIRHGYGLLSKPCRKCDPVTSGSRHHPTKYLTAEEVERIAWDERVRRESRCAYKRDDF